MKILDVNQQNGRMCKMIIYIRHSKESTIPSENDLKCNFSLSFETFNTFNCTDCKAFPFPKFQGFFLTTGEIENPLKFLHSFMCKIYKNSYVGKKALDNLEKGRH